MIEASTKAVDVMGQYGVQRSLIMQPPGLGFQKDDYTTSLSITQNTPTRFSFLGGGASLNPLIQKTPATGVTQAIRDQFQQTAAAIVQAGAVAFGENAALHLSFNPSHPFEQVPPDHPLFLLMADLAALYNIPIDLHMEAVTQNMATPKQFLSLSPNNPPTLNEDISAFERLLDHNAKAKVVWDHLGWDNTGDMTVDLLRRLLKLHPNLYLQLKIEPASIIQNRPLDLSGKLRPEWLILISDFPDRFVLGSDTFYTDQGATDTRSLQLLRSFLQQLPTDLATKVAMDNAKQIYRLP